MISTSNLENCNTNEMAVENINKYFVDHMFEFNKSDKQYNLKEEYVQEDDFTITSVDEILYFYKNNTYILDIYDETYPYITLKIKIDLFESYMDDYIYLDTQQPMDDIDSVNTYQLNVTQQDNHLNNYTPYIEIENNLIKNPIEENTNIKEETIQHIWFDDEKNISNFDWYKYINTYLDLKNDGVDTREKAWTHWINYGRFEERTYFKINKDINDLDNDEIDNKIYVNVDPTFDWNLYINNNLDLLIDKINNKEKAWIHWITYGKKEKRMYCSIYDETFDWNYYIQNNDDLLKDGITTKEKAWLHWTNYGINENRPHLFIRNNIINVDNIIQPKKIITYDNFQWKNYLHNYEDLREITTKKKAWEHWIQFGKKEGRTTEQEIDQNNVIKCELSDNTTLINYNHILFKEKYIHSDKYYTWQNAIQLFIENYKNNINNHYYKYNIFFDDYMEELLKRNISLNTKYLDFIQKNKYKMISFIHNPPNLEWNTTTSFEIQKINNNCIEDDNILNIHLFDKITHLNLNDNILFLYVFSKNHKEYIYKNYSAIKHKILSIYYPIECNTKNLFNIQKFLKNKKIYNIGRYLHNYKTFIDCKLPNHFRKVIVNKNDTIIELNTKVKNIEIIYELSNKEYTDIFQYSCIFADIVDYVTIHTILECISFHTPIILRRTNSAEEYLGKDYPLFFNDLNEFDFLNKEIFLLNLIVEANKYLQNLNKTHIMIDSFNNKINYDLHKIAIYDSNIQLSWCCLVTLENKCYLDTFIHFFVNQKSNNICLFLFIEHDLTDIIYDIEDIMNTYNNIQYIFLEKNNNIYYEFYTQCIQTVNTAFLTIVNIRDEFTANFSSIFIDYLNTNLNCDVAFSSFKYINHKSNRVVYNIYEKDLLLFESNFYNVEIPNTGVVWRKNIHNLISEFESIFYFLKKCMKYHLNIMCITDEPIYSILF